MIIRHEVLKIEKKADNLHVLSKRRIGHISLTKLIVSYDSAVTAVPQSNLSGVSSCEQHSSWEDATSWNKVSRIAKFYLAVNVKSQNEKLAVSCSKQQ